MEENTQETERDEILHAWYESQKEVESQEEETVEETAEEATEAPVVEGIIGVVGEKGEEGVDGVNEVVPLEAPVAEEEKEVEKPKALEPDFKSDKDRWMYEKIKAGEEKEVFEKLNEKYGFERLTDEEKMIAYLGAKHPFLDKEDLAFKAEEYGIGVESFDEDLLSDSEKKELRKQAIERKGLLAEANDFFKERQEAIELPSLANPLDADEDYKAYKERVKQEEQDKVEQEEYNKQVSIEIDTTAKVLEKIGVEVKINIDNGEFDVDVQFDLDDKRRKELAEFAKDYIPTQEQIKAHTANGKFDMKGYMTSLANIKFAKQILNAAVKQAIVKDREAFEARELKNSTLNNREVNQQVPAEMDWESKLMAL